jgi:hypothetical protein
VVAVAAATYFDGDRIRSNPISPGSSPNGQRGAAAPRASDRKGYASPVLSRLLLRECDRLSKDEVITLARIERGVPALVSAKTV